MLPSSSARLPSCVYQQRTSTSGLKVRQFAKFAKYDKRGPNFGLIKSLLQSRDEEDTRVNPNIYKLRAYDTAIRAIDNMTFQITSTSVAKMKETVPGIGDGIARRIQEFLDKQGIQDTQAGNDQPEVRRKQKAIKELQLIPGVGPVKAKHLVNSGCLSISDLRKAEFREQLTRNSQVALDFHDHLSVQASREEAETVASFLRRNVIGRKWELHIVGSYRRGGSSMPDIDILLFHEEYKEPLPFMRQNHSKSKISDNLFPVSLEMEVTLPLAQHGVIACSLSSGPAKWQGIARIPSEEESKSERLNGISKIEGRFKRLNISLAAHKARGAALLVHTGDTDFNRHIRLQASRTGFHLNEYGLWGNPELIPGDTVNTEDTCLCPSETEEIILQQIGLEYVEPGKRNFSNLRSTRSRSKKTLE